MQCKITQNALERQKLRWKVPLVVAVLVFLPVHTYYILFFDMNNITTWHRIMGFMAVVLSLSALTTACSKDAKSEQPAVAVDSVATAVSEPQPVVTDTLRGRITDAASRAIELNVIMDLDLPDDVERNTSIEVGKEVEVVLRHEPDGSQTVVSISGAE